MAYHVGSFKIAGIIYKIYPTGATKKGYPKREMVLEFPTSSYGTQKTAVTKFVVMGDDVQMLDNYSEGEWVEMLFKLDGFKWKSPETGEEVVLNSNKLVDIHRGENPFEGGESLSQDPDANTPDYLAELTKNVKDLTQNPEPPDLFAPAPEGPHDGLPF